MRRVVSLFLSIALLIGLALAYPAGALSYMVGDLDGDFSIGSIDLNLLKRYSAGSYSISDIRCTDINGDLQINTIDINLLKRHLTGSYTIVQPSDEIHISEYTVVYPENGTVYEQYAAEILADTVKDKYGVTMSVVTDASKEADLEILVGKTNRPGSVSELSLSNNQYLFKSVDNDIVINGKDYMIGASIAELCYSYIEDGNVCFSNIPTDDVARDYDPGEADSVILMIGDGMGFNHLKYTQTRLNFPTYKDMGYNGFTAESFPNKGEASTMSLSDMENGTFTYKTTDSAASSTALATGWKTQNKKLGINGFDSIVPNVRELAYSKGYKTGVMSTEPLTGATPSGFTVHTSSRSNTDDIAAQQKALVDNGEIDYLKGDVYDDLLVETKIALDTLSTDSDGFFIMIEEAYIDIASHLKEGYSNTDIALYVYRFDSAIKYAATFTAARPGTVLIVTADHETGSLTELGQSDKNHSAQNLPLFAMGMGTECFNGVTTVNTDIPKFIAKVFGEENFGGNYDNLIE